MKGFLEFVRTQGLIGFAVGFIIGKAVSDMVGAFVTDIVNPVVGLVTGRFGDLSKAAVQIYSSKIAYGDFVSQIINFIIIAFVVYLIAKILHFEKLDKPKEQAKK